MGISRRQSMWAAVFALTLLGGMPAGARAQTFAVGARMASVSGADSPALDSADTSRTRFWGGFARLHLVGSLGFEVSMDYQSMTNDTGTAQVRNTPIQVSGLLLNPTKTFAPFLLGGLGWYKHKVDALDNGETVATAYSTDFGYHLGGGLQLKFGRHAALFADYRYVWVDANGLDGFSNLARAATSLTAVMGLVSSVAGTGASNDQGVSRGGSMWTGGMAIYF